MTMVPTEDALRLVTAIEAVTPLSSALRRAFLTVPRFVFVPRYYERCEQSGEAICWQLVEADVARVAQDDALVTRLDPVTQLPTSSSSQPSVMALQLEALDLQNGQRVLEVGTGTGYNAALLTELVGPTGQVTTIDIDAHLVQQARERLAMIGMACVAVQCGDGLGGFLSMAPYDRLIATGSFRSVPSAWVEQLTPGGILVGNLVGNLASVFLRLVKRENGTGAGAFLPLEEKRYMELHRGSLPRSRFPGEAWYEQVPCQISTTTLNMQELLHHPAFLFFLQCELPEIQRYWRAPQGPGSPLAVCLMSGERTGTLMVQEEDEAGTWMISEYGAGALWQAVQACYARWEQLGKPLIASYTLSWRDGEQWVELPSSALRWHLASA